MTAIPTPEPAPIPPAAVRIGPLRYRVLVDKTELDAANRDRGADADGEWGAFSDHRRLVIGLDPEEALGSMQHSLMHEVLHCSLRLAGVWPNAYADTLRDVDARRVERDKDVEEFTVSALAGPLLIALQENPDLVSYLTAR